MKYLYSFIVVFLLVSSLTAHSSLDKVQFNIGLSLYLNNDWENAKVEFENLLNEHPDSKYIAKGNYWLALCNINLEGYKTAKRHITEVIDNYALDSIYPNALYQLGRIYYLMSDTARAKRIFADFIERYPNNDLADNSFYWKAESYFLEKNTTMGSNTLVEQLKKYPDGNKADAARYKLKLLTEIKIQIIEKVLTPKQIEEKNDELSDKVRDLSTWEELLKTKEEALKAKELENKAKEIALDQKEKELLEGEKFLDEKSSD